MKSKAYLCEAITQRRVLHESELRVIPTHTSPICTSRFRQLIQVLFVYIASSNTSRVNIVNVCNQPQFQQYIKSQ